MDVKEAEMFCWGVRSALAKRCTPDPFLYGRWLKIEKMLSDPAVHDEVATYVRTMRANLEAEKKIPVATVVPAAPPEQKPKKS
jgi:hypothetical protein